MESLQVHIDFLNGMGYLTKRRIDGDWEVAGDFWLLTFNKKNPDYKKWTEEFWPKAYGKHYSKIPSSFVFFLEKDAISSVKRICQLIGKKLSYERRTPDLTYYWTNPMDSYNGVPRVLEISNTNRLYLNDEELEWLAWRVAEYYDTELGSDDSIGMSATNTLLETRVPKFGEWLGK